MTENLAARGEGLAGRIEEIVCRGKHKRGGPACQASCGIQVRMILAALEAAAPASTPAILNAIGICLDALTTDNIGIIKAAIRHQLALATPSPQAPEPMCECTRGLDGTLLTMNCERHKRLVVPAATQEQPVPPDNQEGAGWYDSAEMIAGQAKLEGATQEGGTLTVGNVTGVLFNAGVGLTAPVAAKVTAELNAIVGSPRKVGEDGALAKEIAADLEDAGLVEPGLCGIKAMEIIARRLCSSSVPVGEQKGTIEVKPGMTTISSGMATSQASSGIREAADAIATCLDALNEQNIGLMKAAIRHQLAALSPSRQGA